MFKHLGHLVEKLKRVKIGFLELGTLKTGAYRTLTNPEVARFRKLMKMDVPGEEPQNADSKAQPQSTPKIAKKPAKAKATHKPKSK